mmetsp:Transcript_4681/g.13106  ORF Transcript_4681/g.13106 Transcript_4681/m.13106 type:complete len:281 (-) Transcript_4681:111-953(-)
MKYTKCQVPNNETVSALGGRAVRPQVQYWCASTIRVDGFEVAMKHRYDSVRIMNTALAPHEVVLAACPFVRNPEKVHIKSQATGMVLVRRLKCKEGNLQLHREVKGNALNLPLTGVLLCSTVLVPHHARVRHMLLNLLHLGPDISLRQRPEGVSQLETIVAETASTPTQADVGETLIMEVFAKRLKHRRTFILVARNLRLVHSVHTTDREVRRKKSNRRATRLRGLKIETRRGYHGEPFCLRQLENEVNDTPALLHPCVVTLLPRQTMYIRNWSRISHPP